MDTRLNNGDGPFLRWSRISKKVEIRGSSGGIIRSSISSPSSEIQSGAKVRELVVLDQVSGFAAPGEVLACMGPSGSGKTSLLNTLSGRSSYNSGIISVNGQKITTQSMKRLTAKIAYVKQADIFFQHLTVRDQFTYTALLRMGEKIPLSEKYEAVDRVIRNLRLTKVSESPIRLLSGGEKKRVNIGTELLTDPDVLLLDEPTSGLDSTSAVSLLRLLQNLATEEKKTVITTIHQPSSKVFQSFHRMCMLSEGQVVYFGTPSNSMTYLQEIKLSCPDGYNAAEHWMDLLVTETIDVNKKEGVECATEGVDIEYKHETPKYILQERWDNEALAEEMDKALLEQEQEAASAEKATQPLLSYQKYNTSWMTQYKVLSHRCLKNSRSAIFTPLNMIKSLILGLVAGMLWFQLDYTELAVFDRSSFYFFVMTFWVFDSMFGALLAFPSEKVVILKERAAGSYRLSAYFMAKTSSDAPVRLALPCIFMVVSFWMIGISNNVFVFLGSTGCTLLSVICGEAFGLFIGASIYDFDRAITVTTVVALLLMLLGGFYVENPPWFVSWIAYLSPFKYAYEASLMLTFVEDVPCDGSGKLESLCGGGESFGSASAEDVLNFLGVSGDIRFKIGMLFVIALLPRYGAYLALRSKKAGDRS